MRKGVFKELVSIAIIALTVIGLCVTSFAATDSEMATAIENHIKINAKVENKAITGLTTSFINNVSTDSSVATAWTAFGYTQLSSGEYIYYKKDSQSLNYMYSAIQRSGTSADVITKIDEITGTYNIEADISGAANMASGFTPMISIGIGILCWIIILGQTIYTSFDMCYLSIPAFNSFAEDIADGIPPSDSDTLNRLSTTKTRNGSKFRFVTGEAIYAYKKSNTSETGKSPWGIYMWKRAWSFVATAFVLYIFFSGNITLLVRIGLNWLEGIMQMLKSWG